jgi:CO/xanthine dehydrogenase Mo-binding subunit
VKKDGRLWAWHGKIFYNGGAYGARTPRNGLNGTFLLAGSYRTPHTKMEGYSVYTNQVPCGFFRAPGEVQTLFAVESHMDMMAEALGIEPLELRLRNVLVEGDTKPNGEPLRDPRGVEVLKRVSEMRRPRRPKARSSGFILRGRGLSLGDRHIGTGESNAELVLERDGTLRLLTSVRDQGVGAHTMHRQVVAEIVGVDPDQVRIDVKGTDGPYDEGVRGQRGTHIEGRAVSEAAVSLVESLRKEAARCWNVDSERVLWDGGRARMTGSNKTFLDLKSLAAVPESGSLHASGHWKGGRPPFYAFQALAADVAVDAETGEVTVERLCFALDVTKVINPVIHQGQIDGAVMQGIGHSLIENLASEDGRVVTLSLGDYKIPTIRDIPLLLTALVQANEGPGPFGAKAVAEAAIGIVAPAIANAVYNATGVRIRDLPITPEKILKGLKDRQPPERPRKQPEK